MRVLLVNAVSCRDGPVLVEKSSAASVLEVRQPGLPKAQGNL